MSTPHDLSPLHLSKQLPALPPIGPLPPPRPYLLLSANSTTTATAPTTAPDEPPVYNQPSLDAALVSSVSFADSAFGNGSDDDSDSEDSEDEVAALGAMADHRPTRRRGNSIRAAAPPPREPKAQQDEDGFVPYRPPYISTTSALSLSPPVQPSGAQGIGLAPMSVQQLQPPQEKRRTFFFSGWFFGRRKNKQKLSSASTPTLVRPLGAQSTASFGGGAHHQQYSYGTYGGADPFAPAGLQYATPYGQFGGPDINNTNAPAVGHPFEKRASTVKPSPSVLTGLMAPKMLFSPLARTLRSTPSGSNLPYASTPNLTAHPVHNPHTDPLPFLASEPDFAHEPGRAPYPRVGGNRSWATFPANASGQWTATLAQHSAISLHSEGSKSRLAVTTVCDALTFPRPRLNAHDITPPESPNAPETEEEEDSEAPFSEAIARGEARDAEREQWAEVTRRSRSASLRRLSDSAPSTPATRLGRLSAPGTSHSARNNPVSEKPSHQRSNSASGSLKSFFNHRNGASYRGARMTMSHEDLHNRVNSERAERPELPERSDSLRTASSRTNSTRRGIFGSRRIQQQNQSHPSLPKSTSNPNLAMSDGGRTPRRSQSVRYTDTVSNPDLLSTVGMPGSPARRHRNGPPRSLQFRPPNSAHVRSGSTGVVVVGASTARTRVPRAVDFAEPVRRPPSPSPPPHLPTPERASPFTFSSDEIGVALTTVGNEAASPPPQVVPQRIPMDTPPGALPKEPPSSAHARYLLARQRRRSVTLRAFQSPPMSPTGSTKNATIYPQSASSSVFALSPTFQTRFDYERPEYPTPRRQASASATAIVDYPVASAAAGEPAPPPLPKTSFFARARATSPDLKHSKTAGNALPTRTSTLGPRPKAKAAASTVRPRANSAAGSLGSVSPASPLDLSKFAMPPVTPPSSRTVVQKDKALPSLPLTAPARIPPPRAPPSGPVPPTPPYPPLSRSGSTSTLGESQAPTPTTLHRQSASVSAFGAMSPLAVFAATYPLAVEPSTPNNDSEVMDSVSGEPAAGGGGVVPGAPAPARIQTPPPPNMPTIMDESPTPVRQMTVSVLAPHTASPTSPILASTTSPAALLAFSSNQRQRIASQSRQPIPSPVFSPSAASRHRSIPSVSAVIATPDSFRAPDGRGTPDSPLRTRDNSDMDLSGLADLSARTDATSAAVADTSGVLGRSRSGSGTPDSIARFAIPPRAIGTPSDGQSFRSARSHRSFPELRPASAASEDSAYTSATATTAEHWATPSATPRAAEQATLHDSDSDMDDSSSDATLPDLFPVSSTSALSHYTDALEGSDWEEPSPAAPTVPRLDIPIHLQHVDEAEEDTVDSDSRRQTIVALPNQGIMESLSVTATPRANRNLDPDTENTLHAFDHRRSFERRRSHNSAMSSGSEGSLRPSMDENFRGLFYRTPQVASPVTEPPAENAQRPLMFSRPVMPTEPIGLGYSLEADSPQDATRSDGTFEIRTPVISSEPVPLPFPRSSADAVGTSTMPAAPHPQGLGVSGLGAAFDNRIDMGGQSDSSTPARHDSWITDCE